MSKGQTLKAMVNERLTAAAEEIFVLFEKTIADYEEELCRCKQENQRLQSQRKRLLGEGAPDQSSLARLLEPSLDRNITECPVKEEPEEQLVKLEDKELPVWVPEFSVKNDEDSALIEQRQTENTEYFRSEIHFYPETEHITEDFNETDNADGDGWEPHYSSSLYAGPMETVDGGDETRECSTISTSSSSSSQNRSAPGSSADNSGDMPGVSEGEGNHQCSVCQQRFTTFPGLQRHIRAHTCTVEHYSCPICMKTFTRKFHLEGHIRIHTSDKPFSCPLCKKTFGRKDCLKNHMRTHTGEKPFRCPTCNKAFADQSNLAVHRRTHTGERPYRCTLCDKSYGHKGCLKSHMRTHTGEKLHSCSLCGKSFGKKAYLDIHMRCHTGEKPYKCSICFKAFSVNSNLSRHMKGHEEDRQALLT